MPRFHEGLPTVGQLVAGPGGKPTLKEGVVTSLLFLGGGVPLLARWLAPGNCPQKQRYPHTNREPGKPSCDLMALLTITKFH